jgi:hypothetical protein
VSAFALVVESDAPADGAADGVTPVIEAGGETVSIEETVATAGDAVVAIDPDEIDEALDDEPEGT